MLIDEFVPLSAEVQVLTPFHISPYWLRKGAWVCMGILNLVLLIGILVNYSGPWYRTVKSAVFMPAIEKYSLDITYSVDAETVEFFVTIRNYKGFDAEKDMMARYALKQINRNKQTDPMHETMNAMVYFVPHSSGSLQFQRKSAYAIFYFGEKYGVVLTKQPVH